MSVIISYSEIMKYQTCEREYFYGQTLGLQPAESNATIDTGSVGHKLLQKFYECRQQGIVKDDAREILKHEAKSIMDKNKFSIEAILPAWTLVDNYIHNNEFKAKAFLVENRFRLPVTKLLSESSYESTHIYHDVEIGFTPDIVFEYADNKLDVEDSKFVQRNWPESKVNRFAQSKIYGILLKHMGYNVTRMSLKQFNVKTAEITEKPYFLTPVAERILIRDFMRGVDQVLAFKLLDPETQAEAARTMNYNACQYCSFKFPCDLEAEGKDASKTLKYQYIKRDYDYAK